MFMPHIGVCSQNAGFITTLDSNTLTTSGGAHVLLTLFLNLQYNNIKDKEKNDYKKSSSASVLYKMK